MLFSFFFIFISVYESVFLHISSWIFRKNWGEGERNRSNGIWIMWHFHPDKLGVDCGGWGHEFRPMHVWIFFYLSKKGLASHSFMSRYYGCEHITIEMCIVFFFNWSNQYSMWLKPIFLLRKLLVLVTNHGFARFTISFTLYLSWFNVNLPHLCFSPFVITDK